MAWQHRHRRSMASLPWLASAVRVTFGLPGHVDRETPPFLLPSVADLGEEFVVYLA